MLLKKKYLVFSGLIFIFLVVFGVLILDSGNKEKFKNEIKNDNSVKEGIYKGEIPPDFKLKDLQGREVSLKSYRGKVVLLNFWATWCPSCRKEIPSMVKLYESYKNKGLEIIGINLDKLDKSGIEKFSLEYNITFPILLDPTGKTAALYGITALPATFILDRNGKIQEKVAGGKDWSSEENLKIFETLLSEIK
jgi:peroxiredoxin